MLAAVFRGNGQGLSVEEVPTPRPRQGEALIRVSACGICHTDLHYLDHGVPTAKPPPIILGHEVTGVVMAVEPGEGVPPVREGDRVLVPSTWACRRCRLCRAGRETICEQLVMPGNHVDGGFAEYLRVPAVECVILPRGVPLVEASVVADALSTAFHAVRDRGAVRPGQRAAVFGCGGVGLSIVQCAAAAGARVIAVDVRPSSMELARALGAEAVVDARSVSSVEKEIRRMTGGGVDIAFEAIGHPKTVAQAFASLRRGGRLCAVGYCPEEVALPLSRVMFFEQEIVGSLGCPREAYASLLSLVETGVLKITPLVTGRFPLPRIVDGFDALRRGEGVRSVIVMEDGA